MTRIPLRSDLCGGSPGMQINPDVSAAVPTKHGWHSQPFFQWHLCRDYVPQGGNLVQYTNRMRPIAGRFTNIGTSCYLADRMHPSMREWAVRRAREIVEAGDEVVMMFKHHQLKQQWWLGGEVVPTLEECLKWDETWWSAEPVATFTARNQVIGFALILQDLVRHGIPFSMIVGHAWTLDPDRTYWIERALLWLSTAATQVYVDELPEE